MSGKSGDKLVDYFVEQMGLVDPSEDDLAAARKIVADDLARGFNAAKRKAEERAFTFQDDVRW